MTQRAARRTVPAMALMLVSALSACHSTPPGYQPPDRGARKPEPEQAAVANMQMAIEYMRLNNLGKARERIERALKEAPDNASVQETAGLVYERLNEMSKAQHAFTEAVRLGKQDPDIMNSYAGFLCRTGKAAAGEKIFMAVARNPVYQTPEVALVNAGVCDSAAGDAVDAQRFFDRALAIRPNMPEALLQSGNLALERGDAKEALDYVKRFLAVNQPTAEILWLGFRAQRKLGDSTEAAVYARRVQAEFPNSEQALALRSGADR
ncbi:MAG: type IV pilus biogenesis/stability protein PilW [Steroidobacteraceae bacterium]